MTSVRCRQIHVTRLFTVGELMDALTSFLCGRLGLTGSNICNCPSLCGTCGFQVPLRHLPLLHGLSQSLLGPFSKDIDAQPLGEIVSAMPV